MQKNGLPKTGQPCKSLFPVNLSDRTNAYLDLTGLSDRRHQKNMDLAVSIDCKYRNFFYICTRHMQIF